MSMTQRNTGISAIARPQRQPAPSFKPKSEWKHEEESSSLVVYLPGFRAEQLTITSDYSNRTVKVEGNRPLPSDILLPVNETYNIPEDYNFSKMEKQFGRGILMLKLPRNIVIPQQQITKRTKEETPQPQETVGGDSLTRKDEGKTDPPKETSTTGFEKESPDKAAAIVPPVTTTIDLTSFEKQSTDKHVIVPLITTTIDEKSAKVEEKEKEKRSKSADAKGKEAEKENMNASAKKGMVKELNEIEDRKLIVNIGLAVLIIMGLGISILYLRS
ncbi:hypothetical protein CRYUN_Cryun41cG0057600 [Craigia yunnanensis]